VDSYQLPQTLHPQVVNQTLEKVHRPQCIAIPGGFSLRSNLHAGQWQCRSCQGEVDGDRMFRPTCSYCQFV
jgi:hypothetical protein